MSRGRDWRMMFGGARRRKGGWAGQWDRHRWPTANARKRATAGEIRIMVWIGLILGLLAFHALRLWPEAGPPAAPASTVEAPPDPFAEARRSREILEGQESPPPAALPDRADRGGSEQVLAAAVRIIDGDTFELGGMRVRIADIDTPEVRGRCPYETELAARATRRLRTLLAAGPFELEPIPGRDTDRYGRKLRIVTRGGRSLGDRLVAEGLARTWSGRREPWC